MAASHSSMLDLAKRELRALALARRGGDPTTAGIALAGYVLTVLPPPPGAVVSGFWPLAGEIDLRPLLAALAERGHVLCLPETPPRGQALIFRRWTQGEPLEAGRFGTRHPRGEVVRPNFLLVPLLAFDRRGNRIGYGAGYYDLSFAALPAAFRLGCAFASQEVPTVPVGERDVPLHAVATEAGIIRFAEPPKPAEETASGGRGREG